MTKERDPRLAALDRLAGTWTTEATHPAMPGVVVHGTAVFEWLEGERFLIQRYRTDHPDFPDAISILGFMGEDRVDDGSHGAAAAGGTAEMRMHYHDSRGVFRVLGTSIDGAEWRLWRNAPGFSQRFAGTFSADGRTLSGLWELCRDDVHWADDLAITYRR